MFPEQDKEESETVTVDAEIPTAQEVMPPEGSEAALSQPAPAAPATVEDKPTDKVESENPDAASSPDVDTQSDYDKAAGRKLFFEVQKMGGERVFEASRRMSDTFFNKTPQEFVSEISQYPKTFYPVREALVLSTIKEQPETILSILQEDFPQLFPQTTPNTQTEQFDPAQWAQWVLDDVNASEMDKQAARHLLATQKELQKLPGMEKKMQTFEQNFTQTEAQRVGEQTTKYVDDLMSVVDKTYTESGLDKIIDIETFRNLVVAAHGKDKAANARFQQAMDALKSGDAQTAYLLSDQIKRDGEKVAFEFARKFSPIKSRQAPNTVLPPGVPPPIGKIPIGGPAFDEARYEGAMADITARTS
jgi:hypothetical protein